MKKEVEEARKSSQDVEKKYKQAAEDLDSAKSQLDDMKRQNQLLEKRLQEVMQGMFYQSCTFSLLVLIIYSH